MRWRTASTALLHLAAGVCALLSLGAAPPTPQDPEPGPPLFRPEPDEALSHWDVRLGAGTTTLILKGCATDGTAPVAAGAALLAGRYLDFWLLHDLNVLKRLPDDWLKKIKDREVIEEADEEPLVYGRVLGVAHGTSQNTFDRAARKDVKAANLFDDPDGHRGQVVRGEGMLRRITRLKTFRVAREAGVNALFEAWVFPDALNAQPFCVVFTDWPEGLDPELLGKEKLDPGVRVRFAGYFYKIHAYESREQGKGRTKYAPLVIGNSLTVTGTPPRKGDAFGWVSSLVFAIPAMFLGLLFAVVGITYWVRRNDALMFRRLMAARDNGFVPPTPDAIPVAAPVQAATPAAHRANPNAPQRAATPVPAAHRADATSSDSGNPGGSRDGPAAEDAGG
jgi:hypothetical protein